MNLFYTHHFMHAHKLFNIQMKLDVGLSANTYLNKICKKICLLCFSVTLIKIQMYMFFVYFCGYNVALDFT